MGTKTRKGQWQMTREALQYQEGLRRSSAASPHKNKAKYTRKLKHVSKGWE